MTRQGILVGLRRHKSQFWLVAAAAWCLVAAGAPKKESNWPGWRGPEGTGVSEEANLPTTWNETTNILWKTEIPGRGHSSPIVWKNRVFVTTSIEGEVAPGAKAPIHKINGQPWKHPDSLGADHNYTLKLLCLERETGKILWERTAYEGTIYDDRHRVNTYASPTAVTDGQMVYAYFGSAGLYAYDFKGSQVWKVEVGNIRTVGMGVGTSPVLYENLVILQADRADAEDSYIAAFDKRTGKEIWRAARKVDASWGTPILARTPARTELVTNGTELIVAYDPATGKELWRSKGVESNAIHSPVAGHGMVYVTAGFPKKIVMAIRLGGSEDITNSPHMVWKYDRGTAYVASPILYGDYIYLTTDKGILTCLDARTGEVKYQGGRVPVPATFSASMVAFGGNVLHTSEDGDTFVIKAGPKHEVVRTNSVGEPVFASPAAAGGMIFIRGEKHLFAIGGK